MRIFTRNIMYKNRPGIHNDTLFELTDCRMLKVISNNYNDYIQRNGWSYSRHKKTKTYAQTDKPFTLAIICSSAVVRPSAQTLLKLVSPRSARISIIAIV